MTRESRELITCVLLVALAFRSYVPMGYMPAAGTPFALELCPAQSPGPVATHHQHLHHQTGSQTGNHAQFAHCPFGSAPAVGPIAHVAVPAAAAPLASAPVAHFEQLRLIARFDRAHQARAPPRFA